MNRWPYFRMFAEARNDRKLDTLADDEHRVWHKLLCMASEQEERGVIVYGDYELLAIEVARGDVTLLSRCVTRLIALRIVTDDGHAIEFINFVARNYDKPSDAPIATRERKRKSRTSAQDPSDSADTSRDVTRCHAPEEIRGEEKREEESKQEESRREESEGAATSDMPPRQVGPASRRAVAPPTLPTVDMLEEQLADWATRKGVRDILRDEVERFHDYCLSGKNGRPVIYADYAAACRKWVTNPRFDHRSPAGRAAPPLVIDGTSIPANSRTARNIRVLKEADW